MILSRMLSFSAKVLGLAFLCVCLSGCGANVTKESFNKIKDGMSEDDVIAMLGSPTETKNENGRNGMGWKDGDKEIVVLFVNGKAVVRAWRDGKSKPEIKIGNAGDIKINPFGDLANQGANPNLGMPNMPNMPNQGGFKPNMPNMPNMPNQGDFKPNMPNMPNQGGNKPTVPNMPNMPNMPNQGGFKPNMPNMPNLPNQGGFKPNMPNMPNLPNQGGFKPNMPNQPNLPFDPNQIGKNPKREGNPVGGNLSRAAFDQIQFNWTQAQVISLLGQPTRQTTTHMMWVSGRSSITIGFSNGVVSSKRGRNL